MIEQQCCDLLELMKMLYEGERHNKRFTPWGVAFSWNEEKRTLESCLQTNAFNGLVEELVRLAHVNTGLEYPSDLIPRLTDQYTHYSMLCVANQDAFIREFAHAHGTMTDQDVHFVDGRSLLDEAARAYLAYTTDPPCTLFSFMMHYHPSEDKRAETGLYRHVLERELGRTKPETLFESILGRIESTLANPVAEKHQLAQLACAKPAILDLYRKYVPAVPSTPELTVRVPSISGYLGRRLQRRRSSGSTDDLQRLAEARNGIGSGRIAPEEIIAARLQHEIDRVWVEKYRAQGKVVLDELSQQIPLSTTVESKHLKATYALLHSIEHLLTTDQLKHEMQITQRIRGRT